MANCAAQYDLNPLRILVTLPLPAGLKLCEQIQACHGQAIYLPTIYIQSLVQDQAFQQAIVSLDQQDWLIFISPQAVLTSVPTIHTYWPQLPAKLQIAAIGKGTAEALHDQKLTVTVYPEIEWSSEGLLAMSEFQNVARKHIAIVRGEGGRKILMEVLIKRGAHILSLIAYRRTLPEINVNYYQSLLQQQQIDVIVCTSKEGVNNLLTLLGETIRPDLLSLPLVVVSERMRAFAELAGFQAIWVAKNASHAAVVDVLAMIRKQLCPIR